MENIQNQEINPIQSLVQDILSGNHEGFTPLEIRELFEAGLDSFHIHTMILIGKSKTKKSPI